MPKLSAALVIAGLMCLTACGASSSVTDAPGGPTRSTMPSAAPTSAAASTPAGAVADVASPYTAPDEPPEGPGPLVIRPSGDAADRLGRVSGGDLVDSGGFHQSAFRDDDPLQADPRKISFTTPSGNIGCSGSRDYLVCALAEGSVPLPPEPRNAPIGNWVPYIELNETGLTYGVSAGNPLLPARSSTLPYGSTIRFGDIECLSATDGVTCADFPSGTGFHLSRDDFTPLKAAAPLARDTRVEPRTGQPFCGALVTTAALEAAIATLPTTDGRRWQRAGPTDESYTCRDLQVFNAGVSGGPPLEWWTSHVLVFDRGRFVGTATDRAYANLLGEVDPGDPTRITLTFLTAPGGVGPGGRPKTEKRSARARYQDGRITLLEPIPEGAIPLG